MFLSTAFCIAGLCAERDLAGRHNTGGPGSGRAGRYRTVFRVLNPGAARAGCAVFVMGARPRSVRTRIAHAACPQDPEVVIAHNLLVIVRLLFCLLSLLRILEPPKLPTSARREQSSPVYPDRPQRAKLARLEVAFAIAVLLPLRHSCCLRFARPMDRFANSPSMFGPASFFHHATSIRACSSPPVTSSIARQRSASGLAYLNGKYFSDMRSSVARIRFRFGSNRPNGARTNETSTPLARSPIILE